MAGGNPLPPGGIKESVISWLKIAWTAAKSWKTDNAFKHAASVSFYTLFSLAPVLVIALSVAALFLGKEAAAKQLQEQVTALVGPASGEMIKSAIEASSTRKESKIATAIGIGLLIFGATTVFAQLQESMNQIWDVRSKPRKHGWLVLIGHRLLSFAMVLTIGFLLLVSLVLTTAITHALGYVRGGALDSPGLMQAADLSVGLVVITILFALLFKVLPDVQLRWRDVAISAVVTAVLFTGGRYLIAFYLSHSTVASVYGAAGSLVALLIWIYYSCAILFYGVEFTRAYRQAHRLRVIPKESAVLVREEIVEPRKPVR
jgi:membrane protein